MSLEDILSELKAERPASSVTLEPGCAPWGILSDDHKWSAADKEPSIELNLSRYEAYWLWWRLSVHLKTYEALEWSEMKGVIQCLIQKIESSSKGSCEPATTPISPASAEEENTLS